MKSLTEFFEQYIPLVDVGSLVQAFSVTKEVRKKDLLIKPNDDSSYLAFIKKGAFRVYFYNKNGDETTVWFSFAGMMITDMEAFYKETRANFYIQAIEDSEIAIIRKKQLEELYITQPEYREFGRKYAENALIKVMERMFTLQTKTAEERYMELLQQPKFMQQIPLKYLATYIGITDSSLSRIRKKIR